ncbi:hypothetical protein GFB56_12350 [Ensifer sp. T173]|uniref:Uncharacterized protein n=2 Tax=Sinorhizobium/Ensifer group TaxID=227292 RepID=A0AAW4FHM2_9HYPH|nr:hypothetical protein ASD02_00805 [Ensifer sp. Root1252]KRC84227.1 hypothetical protein ASE32_00800 [Ensifer sp. Root231]KRC86729.1 hypothetical protein ASE47_16850 [Ensifer sp. Root258]MBM3091607.1 hypothetical protein [Ensifer canadensis]UBI77547.1 hypothetical protein J3R84_13005 [Ensifer canadensis]
MTDQTKPAEAAKEKKIPVKLLRDVWTDEGERLVAGAETELPLTFAKKLIDEHKAKRNDPLPGESK